ncbi:MAG: photosystem II reaction center protein Psb28 [Mastigocoleus sp.]
MSSTTPTIQFFAGITEQLDDVRLRRNARTGVRSILLIFKNLKAVEGINSFTKQSLNSMLLTDEEGDINVTPSSTRFIFGGDEGDELQRVECGVEIDQDDHWERVMRFMHRYAEANGMAYQETGE